MATHKKPFHTLRSGGMQAAIRLNDGIKGQSFSMTFSRSLKDHSGAWRNDGVRGDTGRRRLFTCCE